MSASELARRLSISQPTLSELEKSERVGTIRLETLRRAAAAMDCTLIYAFLPSGSLEQIVQRRAGKLVDEHLARVQHTMALEDQEAPLAEEARQDLIREIGASGRLWDRE